MLSSNLVYEIKSYFLIYIYIYLSELNTINRIYYDSRISDIIPWYTHYQIIQLSNTYINLPKPDDDNATVFSRVDYSITYP